MKRVFAGLLLAASLGSALVSHAGPEQGHILVNNPVFSASELLGACDPGAQTNGIDGAWFATSSGAAVNVTFATGATGVEDLDVYFYDAACNPLEPNLATPNQSEEGTAPLGAAWLVVNLFMGADATFVVEA